MRFLRHCVTLLILSGSVTFAQDLAPAPRTGEPVKKFDQPDKFRQLEESLPTPNDYRAASGAPGKEYWQQNVDYKINVELDDEKRSIIGSELVTYRNQSPDPLRYIWLQLDANIHSPDSAAQTTTTVGEQGPGISLNSVKGVYARKNFDGSLKIKSVQDAASGEPLKFTIVQTMMRVDLPRDLATDEKYAFKVDWQYAINNARVLGGRSGYEYFEEDKNCIYEMAQWFPRACAYTDVNGWQHKQYLGRGEFTLEFGDYEVHITVPNDHIVASTGELQNPEEVLTEIQQKRFVESRTAEKPVFVVTPEEAKENQTTPADGKKTWVFKAERVRDFAFASSRKFIWDAMGVKLKDNTVMAMSYYPNEGEPLWSKYSTHAVAHTLDVYSKFTFDYPYPVAISVNGPIGGMEYPMICFNGPRPEKDGTYSPGTKYGLISVVIHEVGHNWFPMIVNSDERQWTWMDEGLNTFLQVLAEAEWEENYPSRRGDPRSIANYMASADQTPVMTNSESVHQFGNNAYAKPAAALTILRETVMGRELFDFAFREYANRWKFRRPMPGDFFRTMEDASGVDLDWFWRGWFYTTDHVDIAVEKVRLTQIDTRAPYLEKPKQQEAKASTPAALLNTRNKEIEKRIERYPELRDFYNEFDPLKVTEEDRIAFDKMMEAMSEEDREIMNQMPNLYLVDFRNIGGLVMPLIVEMEFEDGTKETRYIPAEVWRQNCEKVTKLFVTEKRIAKLRLDPNFETADVNPANNLYPPQIAIETAPAVDPAQEGAGGRRGGARGARGSGAGNSMRDAMNAAKKKMDEGKDQPETPKEESKEKSKDSGNQ
ncbi:MAG: M1 family metallopeptidase [Pirellulaceae bacterium]